MKLLIDIPDNTYANIQEHKRHTGFTILDLIKAIRHGIVLPKYEKHIDHTDCIYYPEHTEVTTCSQYRDGWNDAMDYVFKNGKGYQPYRSWENADSN